MTLKTEMLISMMKLVHSTTTVYYFLTRKDKGGEEQLDGRLNGE